MVREDLKKSDNFSEFWEFFNLTRRLDRGNLGNSGGDPTPEVLVTSNPSVGGPLPSGRAVKAMQQSQRSGNQIHILYEKANDEKPEKEWPEKRSSIGIRERNFLRAFATSSFCVWVGIHSGKTEGQ